MKIYSPCDSLFNREAEERIDWCYGGAARESAASVRRYHGNTEQNLSGSFNVKHELKWPVHRPTEVKSVMRAWYFHLNYSENEAKPQLI